MAQYEISFDEVGVGTYPAFLTRRWATAGSAASVAALDIPVLGLDLALSGTLTTNSRQFDAVTAIDTDPDRATVKFRALIYAANPPGNPSTAIFAAVLRASGAAGAETGYCVSLARQSASAYSLLVVRYAGGSGALTYHAPTGAVWSPDTWYVVEGDISGDAEVVINVRLYALDDLATPIVSWAYTDNSAQRITAGGWVGVGRFAANVLTRHGYAAFATGASELPAAPWESADTTAPTLTSSSASATGATTASGSVSTNEASGTLYYLASANASESAATVKAGSSQAVSATGSQSVSLTGLTASTSYYLHFVHRDAAGNDSAVASSAQFTTSALDTTPPTLTGPTATATGTTTASGTVSTNEATGTLYWIASANATESAATVKAGGSQAVSATGTQSVSVSGLTASTSYYLHYLHRDGAGNDSAVATSAQFTTEAEVVAVKGASIALYNGSTPQASITGIRALWWDVTAPDATPDYYTASASTDASGVLTLDLDATTALAIGDYGYLLLHKDGTLGNLYRDALEFAGAVQITDIS